MLQNAYLHATFDFDTAENASPPKICKNVKFCKFWRTFCYFEVLQRYGLIAAALEEGTQRIKFWCCTAHRDAVWGVGLAIYAAANGVSAPSRLNSWYCARIPLPHLRVEAMEDPFEQFASGMRRSVSSFSPPQKSAVEPFQQISHFF